MARTRSLDYENIQDSILERTAGLFASRGFAATSIGEIAAANECSKSRLYHYFASKEDILAKIMTEHVDTLNAGSDEVLEGVEDPLDRFRALIRYYMSVYAFSRDKHIVLLTCMEFLPDDTREHVIAGERRMISLVQDALARIRPDLAGTDMAHVDSMLFFGMINWTYTWFSSSGKVTSKELADRVVNLFLKGYGFIDSPAERPIPTQ